MHRERERERERNGGGVQLMADEHHLRIGIDCKACVKQNTARTQGTHARNTRL